MIQKDCFTSAWIDTVSKQLKYNDKNLIEKGVNTVEKYRSPQDAANMQIADTLTNKLNKLRGPLPEAFFYWAKTSELLKN
jgi:hypothetical protein